VKRCPRCGRTLAQDEFPKNRSRKDGLGDWCRACVRDHAKKIRKAAARAAIPEAVRLLGEAMLARLWEDLRPR
jgi:hypothetical protein